MSEFDNFFSVHFGELNLVLVQDHDGTCMQCEALSLTGRQNIEAKIVKHQEQITEVRQRIYGFDLNKEILKARKLGVHGMRNLVSAEASTKNRLKQLKQDCFGNWRSYSRKMVCLDTGLPYHEFEPYAEKNHTLYQQAELLLVVQEPIVDYLLLLCCEAETQGRSLEDLEKELSHCMVRAKSLAISAEDGILWKQTQMRIFYFQKAIEKLRQ